MHLLLSMSLCVVVTWYSYYHVRVFLARRRFQQEHRCLPPQRLPQFDRLLGIDTMLENVDCWKRKCFFSLQKSRYDTVGHTFTAKVAGNSYTFTIEPENFKAIFADKFEDFDVGWQRLRAFGPTLGQVLITSDGALWHHQRALLRPAFNRRQISDYRFFQQDIDTLISKIPRDGTSIDLAPLFHTHAVNLATRLLFDEPMSVLNPEFDTKPERFVDAVRETNRGMELRLRVGRLLPLMPRDRSYEEAKDILHEYADAFVRKAVKYRKIWEQDGAEGHGDGEDRYVFLRELAKESEDPQHLRNNMLGMLLVGSESTASFLISSLSVLSSRQDLWTKMRSEVLNMGEVELTYERIKTLTTLNNVMNEGDIFPLSHTKQNSPLWISTPTSPNPSSLRPHGKQGHLSAYRRRSRQKIPCLRTQGHYRSNQYATFASEKGYIRSGC